MAFKEKKVSGVKVSYWQRSKHYIQEFFIKHPSFKPTEKTNWFLSTFFVLSVILGILTVPWDTLLSGNPNVVISVGVPYGFFVLDLMNPDKLPIIFSAIFIDLLIYIILGYALDISINAIWNVIKSKSNKKSIKEYNLKDKKKQEEIQKTRIRTYIDKTEDKPFIQTD